MFSDLDGLQPQPNFSVDNTIKLLVAFRVHLITRPMSAWLEFLGILSQFGVKGRLNEKNFFQENSALQNLGPKIIHEPKNFKKKFRKKFFFENTATSK